MQRNITYIYYLPVSKATIAYYYSKPFNKNCSSVDEKTTHSKYYLRFAYCFVCIHFTQ